MPTESKTIEPQTDATQKESIASSYVFSVRLLNLIVQFPYHWLPSAAPWHPPNLAGALSLVQHANALTARANDPAAPLPAVDSGDGRGNIN
jgi:hypothetical protein